MGKTDEEVRANSIFEEQNNASNNQTATTENAEIQQQTINKDNIILATSMVQVASDGRRTRTKL